METNSLGFAEKILNITYDVGTGKSDKKKKPKHLCCIYTEMSETPIAIRDIC